MAVHWAKSVVFAVKGKLAPLAYDVPLPLAAVFQPENVYPVLVNALVVKMVAELAVWLVIVPAVEPLPLKVTV